MAPSQKMEDGFFRAYWKFNTDTHVVSQEIKKKTGQGCSNFDRAPQHRAKVLREFLRKNPNVKLIYLPKDPTPLI